MTDNHTNSRIKRLADGLVIASFVLGCGTPLVCTLWCVGSQESLREKRAAAPWPALEPTVHSLKKFPRCFDAYYNDHFGLRAALVRLNACLRVHGLGVSASEQVVLGREGWLFYDGDDAMAARRGLLRWSREELDQIQRDLEARRDWLAARGCQYLFVIAPNKESIYPEYLPAWLEADRDTCIDQLVGHLAAHSDVRVLDLRPALQAARGHGLLYFRTDSHWNTLGALCAYRHMMQALARSSEVRAASSADFEAVPYRYMQGDLPALLGLEFDEESIHLRPRQPRQARIRRGTRFVSECASGELPATIMLYDSFGHSLIPFLSEHFQRLVYVWQQDLPVELIERERPGLLIQEIVERRLWAGDFHRVPAGKK
ncbi:MAG: hypothetical protein AB7K24_04030 [Gemmataceae bacterium]